MLTQIRPSESSVALVLQQTPPEQRSEGLGQTHCVGEWVCYLATLGKADTSYALSCQLSPLQRVAGGTPTPPHPFHLPVFNVAKLQSIKGPSRMEGGNWLHSVSIPPLVLLKVLWKCLVKS